MERESSSSRSQRCAVSTKSVDGHPIRVSYSRSSTIRSGAFLPPDQAETERTFKQRLFDEHDIVFTSLYTITNQPINRFLDFLLKTGNYESYMRRLIDAYNTSAAQQVMCRNTLSVGWDGYLFDCDFNQMLDLPLADRAARHIRDFDPCRLNERTIVTGLHCYACTAGAGSSCGGELA